jgi:DNA (cytosine-5)-methyltransferase 1
VNRPLVIDLFSGAGGLSLGAARAGFRVMGAVELDLEAARTHTRNFPKTIHIHADVSKLTGEGLKRHLGLRNGELAGIVGGPPCQGFSVIGKSSISDKRNALFVDFFRLVAELRPSFFLAENVPGILYASNAPLLRAALAQVRKAYTVLPPMKLAAQQYGAPTVRARVFFYGYIANKVAALQTTDFQPPASIRSTSVRDALEGLPRRINPTWQDESQGWRVVGAHSGGYFGRRLWGHAPRNVGDPDALRLLRRRRLVSGFLGTVHSPKVALRYSRIKQGRRDQISKSQRLELDGFCPTLRAGTGFDHGRYQAVRPLHPTQCRVITPREAARLQGFPDWFQFAPTKWHSFRQIGSSVSPILAEQLLRRIRAALNRADKGERL